MTSNDFNQFKITQSVKAYCKARTNPKVADKLWYECIINEREVILVECHPYWKDPSEIIRSEYAKINYDDGVWWLYWHQGKTDRWDLYDPSPEHDTLANALREIDNDVNGCFYG